MRVHRPQPCSRQTLGPSIGAPWRSSTAIAVPLPYLEPCVLESRVGAVLEEVEPEVDEHGAPCQLHEHDERGQYATMQAILR